MENIHPFQGGGHNIGHRALVRDTLLEFCVAIGQPGEGYARLFNGFLM